MTWNFKIVYFLLRIGFAYIGRVGSVAVTVSIAFERYTNCCYSNHDFAFKSLLVPFPILFALIYNIPKFFELTSCNQDISMTDNNVTCNTNETESSTYLKSLDMSLFPSNTTFTLPDISLDMSTTVSSDDFPNISFLPLSNATNNTLDNYRSVCDEGGQCANGYRTTELRNNPWYIIFYVFVSKFLLVELIPWVAVIVLTILTSRKIQQFQANRDRLLRPSRTAGAQDEGKNCNLTEYYCFILRQLWNKFKFLYLCFLLFSFRKNDITTT